MTRPVHPHVEIGALSPDATHLWGGAAWEPLWLLPDEVVDAVRVCFGRVVTAPALLGEGLLNQSWRIESLDDRYVLRVSRPERVREQVAYEHALIRAVHPLVPVAVVPIAGRDGATVQQWHTHLLSLFPFVAGTSGSVITPDARSHQSARALAQIHRASVDLGFAQRPGWHAVDEPPRFVWPTVRTILERELHGVADLAALFAVIDGEMSELDAWLDDLHHGDRSLLRAAVHGDFNPRNLRFHQQTLVGVIDWDHCRVDCVAWEVAQAAFGEPAIDPGAYFRRYLEAGGPLTQDDAELLGGFARLGMLSEVQWTVTALDERAGQAAPRALSTLREVAAGSAWLRERALGLTKS